MFKPYTLLVETPDCMLPCCYILLDQFEQILAEGAIPGVKVSDGIDNILSEYNNNHQIKLSHDNVAVVTHSVCTDYLRSIRDNAGRILYKAWLAYRHAVANNVLLMPVLQSDIMQVEVALRSLIATARFTVGSRLLYKSVNIPLPNFWNTVYHSELVGTTCEFHLDALDTHVSFGFATASWTTSWNDLAFAIGMDAVYDKGKKYAAMLVNDLVERGIGAIKEDDPLITNWHESDYIQMPHIDTQLPAIYDSMCKQIRAALKHCNMLATNSDK